MELDYKTEVLNKYNYFSNDEVEMLVLRAKSILIDLLHPADLSISYKNFDFSSGRFDGWILDCVDELVERNGKSSVVAYRENNMAWTFDSSMISRALINRITGIAGVVK